MTIESIKIHQLENGLTLITEKLPEVSSAAFVFSLEAGATRDPEDGNGAATILTEWLFRGAGDLDNRTLNDRLDSLGLQRHASAGRMTSSFGGALLADNLDTALDLYALALRRPQLTDAQFAPCRELALQNLDSLDDDPRQKISLIVQGQYLPAPYGRSTLGRREHIQALTAERVRAHYGKRFTPQGSILAVAGQVEHVHLVETAERLFGDWKAGAPAVLEQPPVHHAIHHEQNDGAQVHVGVMYASAPFDHPDYYRARAAAAVLSGGMGSRLFTEVREKRGLCYAVMAAHRAVGPYGAIQAYVGSSPDKAQEALDVLLGEVRRLPDGITQDELERAQVGLRASTIMQGESTAARAARAANDYRFLGRVRPLEEIENALNALTLADVMEHVTAMPPRAFTVATLGPRSLNVDQSA